MIRAYVFTLDPTPAQQRLLASHCGAARFTFNHMLGLVRASLGQREAERSYGVAEDALTPVMGWSAYSLRKYWNAIKDEAAPWCAENSKEAYASGCASLAAALGNWGDFRRGDRRGRLVGFPGFRASGASRLARSPPAPSGSSPTGATSPCPGWAPCMFTRPPDALDG